MGTADLRLATTGFHPDHIDALEALITSVGGLCLASGPTAAALHGFDGFHLRPPFDVVVERGRFVHRVGHRIHTSQELGRLDRATVGSLPLLSPTRTIIDLAPRCAAAQLAAAIDSAIRDRGTSEDFLFRRIGELRSSGRYGIPMLLRVLEGDEITRGGQSWLEREVLRLIARADLPRPNAQATLARRGDHLVRVDFHWPGAHVVLEALGYRWHRTTVQLQIDAERMNRLQLAGQLVLQTTYRDVVAGAPGMITDLRRALVADVPRRIA